MANRSYSIFYEGYVGIASPIIHTSLCFDRKGYLVSIYATRNDYPEPGNLGEKVKILYFFYKGARLLTFLHKICPTVGQLLELGIYALYRAPAKKK